MLCFKHVCLDSTAPAKPFASMDNFHVRKQHSVCEACDSKPSVTAPLTEPFQHARNFTHMHTYSRR